MLFYLGWIIAAFLAGVLLMLVLQRRRPTLQQRAFQMGVFAGRAYADIVRTMDTPQAEARQANGHTVRTWRDGDYSISLLFDGRDMCLGVEDEGH